MLSLQSLLINYYLPSIAIQHTAPHQSLEARDLLNQSDESWETPSPNQTRARKPPHPIRRELGNPLTQSDES